MEWKRAVHNTMALVSCDHGGIFPACITDCLLQWKLITDYFIKVTHAMYYKNC